MKNTDTPTTGITGSTTANRPTVDAGTLSFDRAEYKRYWMDTPLNPPASYEDRSRMKPGTCVKTGPHGSKLCGRVHTNSATVKNPTSSECIVIGHGWENWDTERFVWKGTYAEFMSVWEID